MFLFAFIEFLLNIFHMLLQTSSLSFSIVPVYLNYMARHSCLWMPLVSPTWTNSRTEGKRKRGKSVYSPQLLCCVSFIKQKSPLKLNLKLLWVPVIISSLWVFNSKVLTVLPCLAYNSVNHPSLCSFQWPNFHSLLLSCLDMDVILFVSIAYMYNKF